MGISQKKAAPTITVLVRPEKVADWADLVLKLGHTYASARQPCDGDEGFENKLTSY